MDISRRFFLGGAISLLAATTSPLPRILGNKPQIWADGIHDDTFGLAALIRSEPVVLPLEKISIDDHKGVVFHRGIFRISQTIEIPDDVNIEMESPEFYGRDLEHDQPFFRTGAKNHYKFAAPADTGTWNVRFRHHPKHGQLLSLRDEGESDDVGYRRSTVEANGDLHWKGEPSKFGLDAEAA